MVTLSRVPREAAHASNQNIEEDYDHLLQAPTQDEFWYVFEANNESKTSLDDQ